MTCFIVARLAVSGAEPTVPPRPAFVYLLVKQNKNWSRGKATSENQVVSPVLRPLDGPLGANQSGEGREGGGGKLPRGVRLWP